MLVNHGEAKDIESLDGNTNYLYKVITM